MTGTESDRGPTDRGPTVGDLVELEIGPVAHGGHCVARMDGRVVFVRRALPGERVVARLTEVRPGSYCRGVAVEVVAADPGRVKAPCRHFERGCGGCDFQHAAPDLQRRLKATVVAEQLHRLAGLDVEVEVAALAGDGFGWRTRVRWGMTDGRVGPRKARSETVVGLSAEQPCLIATPGLTELALTVPLPARRPARRPQARSRDRRGPRIRLPEVVAVAPAHGEPVVLVSGAAKVDAGAGPVPTVAERALDRDFAVAADGFWQAHPAAADTLAGAVAALLEPAAMSGGSGWDLYGGVGLFAEVLAGVLGPQGSVVSVEGDRRAAELARENLAGAPQVQVRHDSVEAALDELPDRVDLIVLDPPRAGAGPAVCRALAARQPGLIVYVACDPAALARDTRVLLDAGYRLNSLSAFDCFPQTQHVECVAGFVPVGAGDPGTRVARACRPADYLTM